jgi:hypothetical protein
MECGTRPSGDARTGMREPLVLRYGLLVCRAVARARRGGKSRCWLWEMLVLTSKDSIGDGRQMSDGYGLGLGLQMSPGRGTQQRRI